jgi:hypothetical protein
MTRRKPDCSKQNRQRNKTKKIGECCKWLFVWVRHKRVKQKTNERTEKRDIIFTLVPSIKQTIFPHLPTKKKTLFCPLFLSLSLFLFLSLSLWHYFFAVDSGI